MKLNSLIRYHINKLIKLDYYKAIDYLQNKGFNMIGSGCESVVFSRKGFDYVIKLQHSPFSQSGTDRDIPDDNHFASTKVFKGNGMNIIIQEKVEHTVNKHYSKYITRFRKFRSFVEKNFGVSDIHDENVGIIRGRMIVFDWTFGGGSF
jgi:hypothetical protein